MEEMSCERHDELASRTQFVTHTIGRVLGAMDLSVRRSEHASAPLPTVSACIAAGLVLCCVSDPRAATGCWRRYADALLRGLQATSIDTRGFRSLLDLVENTTHDSFELYYGLFMYNQVGLAAKPCLVPV